MNNDLTTNLNTLTDRITDSLKPKFKVGQQVVCVMSKENVTKDNMYVVEESYVCSSNIPCVAVIGDNGKMFRYYQTYFKAADMSKFDVKISVEEAEQTLKSFLNDLLVDSGTNGDYTFLMTPFILSVKEDKELQKALLVLIGEGK
jgi:hypothetical protein